MFRDGWGNNGDDGRLIYHKSTRRVFNVHSQCGEEISHERDGITGIEEIAIARCLGARATTMTQTRNMTGGAETSSIRNYHMRDDELDSFEQQWMEIAKRDLPHYRALQMPPPDNRYVEARHGHGERRFPAIQDRR
jgi:hypothetical protein